LLEAANDGFDFGKFGHWRRNEQNNTAARRNGKR
jgi:hypothetical protein